MITRAESHHFSKFGPSNFSEESPGQPSQELPCLMRMASHPASSPPQKVLEYRNMTGMKDKSEVEVFENQVWGQHHCEKTVSKSS